MQSQHKQILLSLPVLISEFAFHNQREQYIIFWHTGCPHTCTNTQIKCLKCLHTGSRSPFLFLKLPQAPLLSHILLYLQCFLGLTSEMQPSQAARAAERRGLNVRWGWRTDCPCSWGQVNVQTRRPGSLPEIMLLSSFGNTD